MKLLIAGAKPLGVHGAVLYVGKWESEMEQILIILVEGALGGVGAGKSSPAFDLGIIGNIISGFVGGSA